MYLLLIGLEEDEGVRVRGSEGGEVKVTVGSWNEVRKYSDPIISSPY